LQTFLFCKFGDSKVNINDNIVEHILTFACEGWWIGDMYSLISQKSQAPIQVLEDAKSLNLKKKENFE
jgi:hypothetical protein